jgi:hypothetical protein
MHFDVDLVDFLDVPLAENTDRGIAPSLTACGVVLSELHTEARVRALTVTEFNPVQSPVGTFVSFRSPRQRAPTCRTPAQPGAKTLAKRS